MTTTVAVGFGGIGLAAAGAVAAGAVGLGLLALVRRRSRSRSKSPVGYGHGRKRREPQNKKALRKKESETKALQRVMDLIRQQDVTGCGMKLVCELAGLSEDELDEEQRAILTLVDKIPDEDVTGGGGGGGIDYKSAMILGRAQGSCVDSFPLCALSGTELMQTIDYFIP